MHPIRPATTMSLAPLGAIIVVGLAILLATPLASASSSPAPSAPCATVPALATANATRGGGAVHIRGLFADDGACPVLQARITVLGAGTDTLAKLYAPIAAPGTLDATFAAPADARALNVSLMDAEGRTGVPTEIPLPSAITVQTLTPRSVPSLGLGLLFAAAAPAALLARRVR
ncbi:MAG: hypothetical protein ACYDDF_01320 [Thermoplasmatota archaeon]